MVQRCTRRDTQEFVINFDIATDQQVRNSSCSYVSLFPQVLPANGISSTQNFNSLRYAGICSPTSISRNRWEDQTWALIRCRAKPALAELVLQQSVVKDIQPPSKKVCFYQNSGLITPIQISFFSKRFIGKTTYSELHLVKT